MYVLRAGEVVRGTKVVQYEKSLYESLACAKCGKGCRVRGKPKKGVSRGFLMPDGTRICGRCKRSQNALASRSLVRYAGSLTDLIEDVEWMLDSDESAAGAAKRLGFRSVEDLYHILRQLDRRDLVARFENLGVIIHV